MSSTNGNGSDPISREPVELRETLLVQTKDGAELSFEVVGIVEDPDDGTSYAVLMHAGEGDDDEEFIVTDMEGNLLPDDALAQEVLDEFLLFAEEAGDQNGGNA